ncbi:COesterase domain-containing protein [Aphelenchoides besseyi]|nr:COesterase domain-containing protein [Aphelenchoides besseyi]
MSNQTCYFCLPSGFVEVVETHLSNGSPLRGYVIKRGPRIVHTYRGIPFARPPVGKLRFQKPQTDLEPWTEPLNFTHPKPACPGGNRIEAAGFEVSEDCLYIDVYIDPGCKNTTCTIGVDLQGSSSTILPDGMVINHSRSDPELMVFIGHRFGAFGFLDVGNELPDNPYNVGLYDLIEGLKWIKREAANFHGDPTRITTNALRDLASMFHHLLVSPAIDRDEISLSVQMLNNHRPLIQPHFSLDASMKLLKRIGCDFDLSEDRLNCLREKPMDEIWDNSPPVFEFGVQADSYLLPAQSYIELLDNWKPVSLFTISPADFPYWADQGKSAKVLCETYASYMFGYKSDSVTERCVDYYSDNPKAPEVIGSHAVHALNSLLGSLNKQMGGQTYAAVFAQPGHDGGTVRLLFADSKPETVADHKVHEWMLSTREAFGHKRTRPAEDFEAVNEKGENFYFMRSLVADDNVTLIEKPQMHVGEIFESDAVRFWLVELARLESNETKSKILQRVMSSFARSYSNDLTKDSVNHTMALWLFGILFTSLVMFVLFKGNNKWRSSNGQEKSVIYPSTYQSIS